MSASYAATVSVKNATSPAAQVEYVITVEVVVGPVAWKVHVFAAIILRAAPPAVPVLDAMSVAAVMNPAVPAEGVHAQAVL